MRGSLAGNPLAAMVVGMRRAALTVAVVAIAGFVAAPQQVAMASDPNEGHGTGNGNGPVWSRNQGQHNQNAPAINSPTTVVGVQQVNSVSENTNTQNGLCRKGFRFCKIKQKMRLSRRGW
ncbi:hypothetical protein Pth03_62830 [Planotetraspora thailandica]|uniref:Uncharacterized protein n=1 Tax=Planotetraspora thailandica TaxID=487172 RepID=A0A8J3V4Z5_9ACTN|nr:hypothetical protein [Planotetraspora thailandica]GII57894.1 hypothetical protein Pth03_62830 [Planotetraspora thailandica]